MFGAWQAGAWAALARDLKPDLVVGASAGALNGYVIASGADPEELIRMWLDPHFTRLGSLSSNIEVMMRHYRPSVDFALTVTDLLRRRSPAFRNGEITARHLAASCALPFLLPQVRIDGRWYSDGGLLNALPLRAAVDWGATHIVALHAIREDTFPWWSPTARKLRALAGVKPYTPEGVSVRMIQPSRRLGGIREFARWKRGWIEQWIAVGRADGRAALLAGLADGQNAVKKTFPF